MNIILYIIVLFAVVQLIIALLNMLFAEHLPKHAPNIQAMVSIVIPARNEEANIGLLLVDLQVQPYQNIEVIVYNDQSTDSTSTIVENIAKADPRFRLIHGKNLPETWGGKTHACYQGATYATGDYILFLDADVRLKDNTIEKAIGFMEKHKINLLSIFPKQQMHSVGEWCSVPLIQYILLTLLPLPWVQRSCFSSHAAANGQFMLFKADSYKQLQPHKHVKDKMVEDIAIARWFKKQKLRVSCILGNDDITCRMYKNYSSGVAGLSRSLLHFFGGSAAMAIFFVCLNTLGILFVLLWWPWYYSLLYILLRIGIRTCTAICSKQPIYLHLIYALPQQITLMVILIKSIYHTHTNSHLWKERKVLS